MGRAWRGEGLGWEALDVASLGAELWARGRRRSIGLQFQAGRQAAELQGPLPGAPRGSPTRGRPHAAHTLSGRCFSGPASHEDTEAQALGRGDLTKATRQGRRLLGAEPTTSQP